MKIESSRAVGAFQPVSLTITFETQTELDAWAGFFDCIPIEDCLRDLGGLPDKRWFFSVLRNLGGHPYPKVKEAKKYLTDRIGGTK